MLSERQVKSMTIGQRIKRLREELGMSQEELAMKIGFKSRSSINKIELDKQFPKQSTIAAFARILNTTPNYLLGVDNETIRQEKEICDLFSLCYGKEAYAAVQKFLRLDPDDRQDIVDLMDSKLRREKYAEKEKRAIDA